MPTGQLVPDTDVSAPRQTWPWSTLQFLQTACRVVSVYVPASQGRQEREVLVEAR